jgi:uncharacterized membrane protein (UPF0127 family)
MECKFLPISRWGYRWLGPHKVIVADTVCKSRQGVQGAEDLLNGIILFPRVVPGHFFTTVGCLVELEIMPLDKQNRVLDIWTEKPGKAQVGPIPEKANKVIEAPKGWCRKFNVKKGDRLQFLEPGSYD